MADNLTTTTTVSTIPSGSVIATDDAGAGGHVQIVKLAVSTDGSATALTADNTNGLLVNLGSNNDVTLATLPDTAAGDLAAINTAVSGTLTVGSHAVTNAGTFAVQESGAALTALQVIDNPVLVDDAAFTPATSSVMVAGFEYDDTLPDSVDEGDAGAARMSANRNIYTQIRDAAGNERGLNIDASGQIAVTNAGTFAVQAAQSGTWTLGANSGVDIGDVDVTSMPGTAAEAAALPSVFVVVAGDDGTDTHPLQLDASGHLQVDIAADSVGVGGGTQYTEDVAAAADPVGNALILVRQDTPATLVSLDGDNVAARATNYGAQFVQVLDSSGNFINTFGGSGGTATADDGAFTAGSGQGTPAMGFFSADTVDSGDVGVLAMDASRRLLVSIEADNVGIGGGTQYAVDTALGATPTGTLAVAIRDDALSALTPVEGDAIGLRVDANGALWTIPSGTVTIQEAAALDVSAATVTVDLGANNDVINAGTFAVQEDGAALTALQLIDDTVATLGTTTYTEATSKGNIIGAVRNDTLAALANLDNEIAPLQVNASGALYIQEGAALDVSAATVPTNWNGTAPPIGAGLEATALRVTLATDSTGLVSVDDNGGALTVDWNGIAPPIGAGLEATALRVTVATDSTGVLSIDDNAGSLTVDNAGTFAVQAASAGDVAHDGADSGNPVKVGFKAIAHGTNPTAVAAADRTDWYANRAGIPFVIGGHPNIITIRANYTAAQTDTAIVTISTGSKIVVTRCSVLADNANTVDVAARVGFGTANTPTTTGVVLTHPGIAPGSGAIEGDGSGILGVGADNEDLRITSEVPTSGSIDVLVSYYTVDS